LSLSAASALVMLAFS